MDNQEVLFQEYNNLWQEKLIHKQSIRKFHHYLTYITAIGSLVLTLHGSSIPEFLKGSVNPDLLKNAASLFFIFFTPVILITLTFPLNDIYHIYAMGHQIGTLEKKINNFSSHQNLLTWEHLVCPIIYGGNKVVIEKVEKKLTNPIMLGDFLLLIPFLGLLCISSSVLSCIYLYNIKFIFALGYVVLITYMIIAIVKLALKIKQYTKADGSISRMISKLNKVVVKSEKS
jgi:hypothetical protein